MQVRHAAEDQVSVGTHDGGRRQPRAEGVQVGLDREPVEIVADKFIVIVDESKLCDALGPGFPVPVEITPFCHEHTIRVVGDLPALKGKCKPVLRMGSSSNNQPDGDEVAVAGGARGDGSEVTAPLVHIERKHERASEREL